MKTRHYPFYRAACQTLWSVGVCRCGWCGLYVALRWLHKGDRSLQGAFVEFAFRLLRRAKGGWASSPPLAIPPGTRLRGPAGSLRCSAWQGPAELGSSSLKQAAVLFPANPALLARVNGDWVRAVFTHCNTPDRSHALRPVWRSAEAITALLKHIQRININRPAHLARQRVLFQRRQQHVHQLVQHRALGGLHQ